ncbi:hypothetical protein DFH09DRAFT_1426530 [Mycena vulgaris]|nr:hypothetical protein DFH09DRAFT_1426530 [Mycena vulgaris]
MSSPKQANDPTRHEQQAAYYAEHLDVSLDLPVYHFPRLRFFSESSEGVRSSIDQDPAYTEIRGLALTVFSHLAGCRSARMQLVILMSLIGRDPAAKKALVKKLGTHEVSEAHILDFFTEQTPSVVVKDLNSDEDADAIVWGLVVKGDADHDEANANEIFISLDLTASICNAVRTILVSFAVAEAQMVHLIGPGVPYTGAIQEATHALTKHLFGPLIVTPHFGFILSDGKGNGDAGQTFEKDYLGFHLEAAWTHTDELAPLILDDDVGRIHASFETDLIWTPKSECLSVYGHSANTHARHRIGVSRPMQDEEEEERPDLSDMVVSTMCMPRVMVSGVGLGYIENRQNIT